MMLRAIWSSHVQVIFIPPVHFSILKVQRGTIIQFAGAGMTCEWTDRGYLRISNQATAISVHPVTDERVFFNQVQLHHVSCLDEETRESLRQLFSEEELPRNVHFGDGTPIPDETMARLGEIFEELCVEFPWDPGDMIVLDNMLVAHARRPFGGERKILVAMGRMMNEEGPAAA